MSTTLPSGTVTFLFTDIEGSTPLWEGEPELMHLALKRHDAILRESIEDHGGRVFKTIGDAFQAAFLVSFQAVAAALTAQRRLAAEPWPTTKPIRVRMGIHAGHAIVGESDYITTHTLNRVARIMSAAHGGQILLSLTVAELVQGQLNQDVVLRDLGEHSLKGLTRHEHLFQVVTLDLSAEFPLLKTEDRPRHNLPAQLTSFIGRENEIARVKDLLKKSRLVTLTGSGGVGKTRLALRVAEEEYGEYSHGVWLVELASLGDPGMVPWATARVFGLREEKDLDVLEALEEYLHSRQLLLVLDNCEHLIEACAGMANKLLHACPQIRILASSREALSLDGEIAYPVPSLPTPDPRRSPKFETIAQSEAIQLFIDRARTALPDFDLNFGNVLEIAKVTRRLDGIPLAIELAAARVRVLRIEQIAQRLDESFRLLTGGSRTALPRHQTLRALIDWSYQLLAAPERVLFRRLAVFSNGWALEATESVCSDKPDDVTRLHANNGLVLANPNLDAADVLDLLTQLVNKSLVSADRQQGTETRYRFLETIRQFSREKLLESGESESLRSKHLQYFLELAEKAEPELWRKNQKRWLDMLEVEHDNLQSALQWSLELGEEWSLDAGLRISVALEQFWMVRGHWIEGREWFSKILSHDHVLKRSSAYPRGLFMAGRLASSLGEQAVARSFYEKSLEIGKLFQDKRAIADSLRALGVTANWEKKDYREAHELLQQSLDLCREIGDQAGLVRVLSSLGHLALNEADIPTAFAYFQENLAVCRELGHQLGIAGTLISIGEMAFNEGNLEQAQSDFEESLAIYRDAGDRSGMAWAGTLLGEVFRYQGSLEQAVLLNEEACAIFWDIGDKRGLSATNCNLGFITMRRGDPTNARRLFEDWLANTKKFMDTFQKSLCLIGLAGLEENAKRAAVLLGMAAPYVDRGFTPADHADYHRIQADTKGKLGEAAFSAGLDEGRALAEKGIEYVLQFVLKKG